MPPESRSVLSLIAAVAENGVIGNDNALPWHLPDDLKRFKAITMGHPVIMGRKTYESIGRPLPGRRNIVISRNPEYMAEGCETANSLSAAIAACSGASDEIFVIGGAQIYAEAMPKARRLYLTEIRRAFEGNARFPTVDSTQWREVSRERFQTRDGLNYDFAIYNRS